MKKSLSLIFTFIAVSAIITTAQAAQTVTKTKVVVPKAPVANAALKSCIVQYKQGNYIGAMQDLKEILKKDKNNTYAKYYLALCYTQLGYAEEATKLYEEVKKKNDNQVLSFYSTRALACLSDETGNACKPVAAQQKQAEKVVNEVSNVADETAKTLQTVAEDKKSDIIKLQNDDMKKFIESGKQFHPSVTDRVVKERMERKIQADEYKKKQMEDARYKSDASIPTNEEIAAALNTLSKIGMNPYSQANLQNQMFLGLNQQNPMNSFNPYNAILGTGSNTTPDAMKMLLYSQMASGQNNFMNFGI